MIKYIHRTIFPLIFQEVSSKDPSAKLNAFSIEMIDSDAIKNRKWPLKGQLMSNLLEISLSFLVENTLSFVTYEKGIGSYSVKISSKVLKYALFLKEIKSLIKKVK